jgi:glycosyltransferase involved in cell wall biosynthesis
MKLSVILPTYNPDPDRLTKTLGALRTQSLDLSNWELIIIDNNSTNGFVMQLDLSWHPAAKLIIESKQGLTFARLKGFEVSDGEIIVLVDDDNSLRQDYLERALKLFDEKPLLGAAGGTVVPDFESTPPSWISNFYDLLAIRNLGNEDILETWQGKYPKAAPIGAGMVLRRQALLPYIKMISSPENTITDRQGNSLGSGGDNEINILVSKSGWLTGYFPELLLHHLIPKNRTEPAYLARLAHDMNKSWMQVLKKHQINPWAPIPSWTVLPRRIKSWFVYKAWKNQVHYIRWQGACGMYRGLVDHSK